MARKSRGKEKTTTLTVSTEARPDFKAPIAAYAFSGAGELLAAADVKAGKVRFDLPPTELKRARVFFVPRDGEDEGAEPTIRQLEKRGAYEPVLSVAEDGLLDLVRVPGTIIDHWPWCLCWVRGQVLRANDNRPVCDARVHICEVDKLWRWILELPPPDVFRLRDDLIEVLRNPPIPDPPGPFPPEPRPEPIPLPIPGPGPDPAPFGRPLFRLDPEPEVSLGVRGVNLGSAVSFNPQPDPPKSARPIDVEPEVMSRLLSSSASVVRTTLADNWQLIYPWLCLWPVWWRFVCDEITVVTTGNNGRFETIVGYPCNGDHPDLYFWVEFDFGSGFETVYHPPIACNTYWNYNCGSEVTIRINDNRLPACGEEPDLPGCQVVVNSIGNDIAVRQLQTDAAGADQEGLTTSGQPFGGTLEPRVDFSRTELITGKGIPYYRWSYKRLSGPDGVNAVADPSSVPIGSWAPLTRAVHRHYKDGTSYPSEPMGPMPTTGPGAAPAPNLFRIRPKDPPSGSEWIALNQHVDLATGYFETAELSGTPSGGPIGGPAPDDLAAGRYELKLELFDSAGALVNWTLEGVDLRITDQDAPFGPGLVTTSPAPDANRIKNGAGETIGFRMVVRVDNNHCYADIKPVAGDLAPDPLCGFHTYLAGDDAGLSFEARHPNKFARYTFTTRRASGPAIAAASTYNGTAGENDAAGFSRAGFVYSKDVPVATLLGACDNAAFAEWVYVYATAINGYSRLSGYDHADNAAFALAKPCEPCECEEEEGEE